MGVTPSWTSPPGSSHPVKFQPSPSAAPRFAPKALGQWGLAQLTLGCSGDKSRISWLPSVMQWLPAPIPPALFGSKQVFSPHPCECFLLSVHMEIIQEFRSFLYLSPGTFSHNNLEAFSLLQLHVTLAMFSWFPLGIPRFLEFSTGTTAGAGIWNLISHI